MAKQEKSSRGVPLELIRENQREQDRVRRNLEALGGELRPQINGSRAGKANLCQNVLKSGVRVEVRADQSLTSNLLIKGLMRILASCGFPADAVTDAGPSWEGVHVESRTDNAEAAILVQGAFRIAGIRALLTIHERAPSDRILLYVGADGLG